MACSFCRSTPVSPCPVCEVQHPLTPKAVRKPKARTPAAAPRPPPIAAQRTVSGRVGYQFSTDPEVVRLRQLAMNNARVVPSPTLQPRPVLVGWHAAAAFTLGILNRKRLPATIDGEVVTEKTTIARQGLKRGDWAGLARAVDAGWMTDAEAIEMAQGWRAAS